MLITKYIYIVTPLFGLKAEAEGHAKRTARDVVVGVAGAVDNAEKRGVAAKRRALPPVARAAAVVLNLAVARLVVVVLRALAALGIAYAAENLDLAQQEQFVRRGVNGGALAARRCHLIHLPDAVLYLRRHQRQNGRQVRSSHCAARPVAAVGVGAVHVLGLAVAVVQLEGQRCLPAGCVGVVVLADDVDLIIRAVNGHHFAVAYRPAIRYVSALAGCDDCFP